jgi:mannosylglycerate hydrolase MGH1-like protein
MSSGSRAAESAEEGRLRDADEHGVPWRRFGPYLSDRQWGTVREDYSLDGDAWNYFSHDQARSRVYRSGEDGIAGVSDDRQLVCLALALWNGRDAILKERFYGLTNSEANHGEDAKEYWFHLDSTPTHSHMRMLYKYPQAAFPYADLVETNRARSRTEMEYELLDTGVFDEDRYFDVFVEYAKAAPDDLLCRITVANRGPDAAELHVLPTVWFRNTWGDARESRPRLRADGRGTVRLSEPELGEWVVHVSPEAELLFTENETNVARIWGDENATLYVKDGINDHVVAGLPTVNPEQVGTKAAAWHRLTVPAGGEVTVDLRLRPTDAPAVDGGPLGPEFAAVLEQRREEDDEFYDAITPPGLDEDAAMVMRRALAGMLWTKQWYGFDVDTWLHERDAHPLRAPSRASRNSQWFHMRNADVISMPDKWEYPWYAAWDLAFHCVPLTMVDPAFARNQLELMLSDAYLHPSGQIPAYEWNFGDVNPPVHAWGMLFAYHAGLGGTPEQDLDFLGDAFKKLLVNFTWWVNRKDPEGHNLFEGGFLGLDNIGVFDRSAALPTGGRLEQADGTAWMALFSQNMLELSLELATRDSSYEDIALKFVQHFFLIAASMDKVGQTEDELWDEEDGFFYDVLRLPDGSATRLKVRSLVGLLPMCAVTVISPEMIERFPTLAGRVREHVERHRDYLSTCADPLAPGVNGRRLLSVLDETKLRRVLARMLDEERFLGPHGIRSLSRWHLEHPYVFDVAGQQFSVNYLPAESDTGMFGGNSNWRGPVWFPVNLLIIRALLQYYLYYGDDLTIECPTGSGNELTLFEVAKELAGRLSSIFMRDADGRRPVYGQTARFQDDPHWRDLILFFEYFHGDNGAGLGATHQTGWTGAVAKLIQLFGSTDAETVLNGGTRPVTRPYHRTTEPAGSPT